MCWLSENWKWFVPTAILVIAGIILAIIFIPKYEGPGENCIFISESANLHKEYLLEVKDVAEYDEIEILLNKGDVETHSLYTTDTHFIAVTVSIKRSNTTIPQEDHIFDKDDFKLKGHTGVKLKNVYFGSVKDGFVYYETHNTNELKLLEIDYGKTWRCWARRPTDEERAAAAWEVE
jgi:hypothetical protein